MKFKINGEEWNIIQLSNSEINELTGYVEDTYTHGYSSYSKNTIYLNNTTPQLLKTLKHELTHVWLYEYAHNQETGFNNEEVCQIIAQSNDFINEIVEKYKKEVLKC